MGFWKHPETDLERELRAQRPAPRNEFVQMLGSQLGGEKSRPSRRTGRATPRIALVGAATLVLAASLGVAGALGHAGGSFRSFGTSVYHVVHAPRVKQSLVRQSLVTQNSSKENSKGDAVKTGTPTGDPNGDNDHEGHIPFHDEYHHQVPICHNHVLTNVISTAYLPLILHSHGEWTAPFFEPLRCTDRR